MGNSIYDYIIKQSDVEVVLDYYNLDYNVKKEDAWLPCPFHSETEPSFVFNLEKKIYKCWGCKVKGNIIKFIVEYELIINGNELSYYEGAMKLARICKIKVNLSHSEKLAMEMENIDDISDLTNEKTTETPVQEVFQESAIKKFYVKKHNYMIERGFKQEVLDYLEMGFFTGDTKNPMNNRCVFPIRNITGGLIGWTGRSVIPNVEPKWFHAPAKRFLKSLALYNIDKAIDHIYECGRVNVVESPGNVIGMIQSGRYNTVATLGSTISKEQCDYLLSLGVHIVFWYDWDEGGFEGINLALEYMSCYDEISIAITDYGYNDKGKARDLGEATKEEIDNTPIVSVFEFLNIMKERYVSDMADEFLKDKKIKLTDGTVVLCTNKINPKVEIPQLLPSDVTFFKNIDNLFGVTELSLYHSD